MDHDSPLIDKFMLKVIIIWKCNNFAIFMALTALIAKVGRGPKWKRKKTHHLSLLQQCCKMFFYFVWHTHDKIHKKQQNNPTSFIFIIFFFFLFFFFVSEWYALSKIVFIRPSIHTSNPSINPSIPYACCIGCCCMKNIKLLLHVRIMMMSFSSSVFCTKKKKIK